ncbi:MAG: hypothetical protein LLG13_16715 [Bacteroidales bacterium]|nr:hypothetical protein [Bacteroidales bacterium]
MRAEIIIFLCLNVILKASTPNEKSKQTCRDQVNSIQTYTTYFSRNIKVDSFNLNILPPSSGVQFYKDGIVFLSSSKSEGNMLADHLSFGKIDAWYAGLRDSVLENHVLFSPSSAFPFPCDAISFNSNFDTMFFTKYSKNDGPEKIYRAKFSAGKEAPSGWVIEDSPLSICSDQSTYTHPALSADGSMMIFASNRPGSVGGMDLFITRNNSGSWSTPLNLGEGINTKSNELFPYLDSENNLFFSSDGLPGYGGYDVFMCKFNKGTWGKPINLSTPLNTKFDDEAFKLNRTDEKSAFYTVKNQSGKQDVQLYLVRIKSNIDSKFSQLVADSGFPEKRQSETLAAHAVDSAVIYANKAKIKKDEVAANQKTKVSTELKVEQGQSTKPIVSEKKDVVLYRVQILSNNKSKGSYIITINNKKYSTFEYYYKEAFRTCIGEFSTIASAKDLQKISRQSGYPQAFVVAFINDTRSTDPELFR